MEPNENIIRDETTFIPVENSGEGEDQQVEITRNIEKSVVETITIGEARNKADFLNRQIADLITKKESDDLKFESEKDVLQKELDKYQNIINSVS